MWQYCDPSSSCNAKWRFVCSLIIRAVMSGCWSNERTQSKTRRCGLNWELVRIVASARLVSTTNFRKFCMDADDICHFPTWISSERWANLGMKSKTQVDIDVSFLRERDGDVVSHDHDHVDHSVHLLVMNKWVKLENNPSEKSGVIPIWVQWYTGSSMSSTRRFGRRRWSELRRVLQRLPRDI